jgi:large subunit ribosomal protein L19
MEEQNTTVNTEETASAEVVESTATSEAPAAVASSPKTEIRINGGKIMTSMDKDVILKTWPDFNIGDTIKVHYRIVEGDKQRIQIYEGNVISIRGEGLGKSFIVRRISHEVGVERIFPYHSPVIAKIEQVRSGRVRRSKLFYLRDKTGKSARIKEAKRPISDAKKKSTKKTTVAKKTAVSKKPAASKKTAV